MASSEIQQKLAMSLEELVAESGESSKTPRTKRRRTEENIPPVTSFAPSSNPVRRFTVKVSNLADSVQERDLLPLFTPCGEVASIQIPQKGHAYIAFHNRMACSQALQTMQKVMLKGLPLKVEPGRSVLVPATVDGNKRLMPSSVPREQRYSGPQEGISEKVFPRGRDVPIYTTAGFSPAPIAKTGRNYRISRPRNREGPLTTPPPPSTPYAFNGHERMRAPVGGPVPTSETFYSQPYKSGSTSLPMASIIVSNVPTDLTAQEIQDAFSCVGNVFRTEIMLNSIGDHTGRAVVVFETHEAAEEAMHRFDGGDLNSHTIRIFVE